MYLKGECVAPPGLVGLEAGRKAGAALNVTEVHTYVRTYVLACMCMFTRAHVYACV